MISTIISFFVSLFDAQGVDQLAEAARKTAPKYLTKETARSHAAAAKVAESPDVPAEVLLSMTFFESRHMPGSVSRVEGGKRKTGIPPWDAPPSNVRGPYFCGLTQAAAGMSWKRCLELQDVLTAYTKTVAELERWLKVCKGNMTCALTGYGGGFPAIKLGTSTYPTRVLSRARALERAQRGNS